MPPRDVPTTELGTVIDANLIPPIGTSQTVMTPLDDGEEIGALRWPESILVFERMRNTIILDTLLEGLLSGIEQYRWGIRQDKASQAGALRMAEDLGIPLIGEAGADTIETSSRFSHPDFLHHALLAVVFGHYYFEIKGEVRDGFARLLKLAPRPPKTIMAVNIDADAGVDWIQQTGFDPPKIPVERLVLFVWRKEAGNWFGRSIMRSSYGPWLARDRLIRDDLTKHRRNATGMPRVTLTADPTTEQKDMALALVNSYRSADKGGGVLPFGMEFALDGVSGATSDPIESAKYHDGMMTARFAQMVIELGRTASGSRGLGNTMDLLLKAAQAQIADWYAGIMQQHVLEKFTLYNEGPGAYAPKLVYDADPDPKVADVQAAVKDGVIRMDDGIENLMREKLRLPPIDQATLRQPAAQAVIDPATGLPAAPFPARRARPAPAGPATAPAGR